jgi:probable FeS assembly SUF system protein SufT
MSSKLPVVGIVEAPAKRDEPEQTAEKTRVNDGPFEEEKVWEQLRTVFDPEIPVNVVELGLIYRCEATELPDGGHRVDIDMSMTAPGCGMADVIQEDVRRKVRSAPGVREVNVRIVWDPPWDASRMSDAARLQLGWM